MAKKNNEKINKLKQFGYYTKGFIYGLMGVLAAIVAFGLGGDIKSESGIANFIGDLPGGELLSVVLAFGVAAYTVWCFYAAIIGPHYDGDGKKVRLRLMFAYSGFFYALIAFSFAKPILDMQNSTNGSSETDALNQLLNKDWGVYIIWIIAILMAGNAIWQLYLSYSGKFMKQVDDDPRGKEYTFVKQTGKYGYFARGVVFGILSFFMVKVSLFENSEAYKGVEGAFEYLLQLDYGAFLMAIVALGMIGYGLFCMMVARYSNLTN